MIDYTVGDTINFRFTTRKFSDGVPTTLAGVPVLSVMEDAVATAIVAGVSVSVDQDGVAGLNLATIVATVGNGFESGKEYDVYISTGTVGGVSVVGEVVGHFTLGRSAAAVDLANATDGLGALKTLLDGVSTTADLLDKLGAVNEAAAAGDPSATESVMQYVKQIVNILAGADGIVTMPAAAAPANNVSVAEMVRAIYDDTNNLQTSQGNWLTATGFATPTNITAGTITTVTNVTTVSANGITTSSIATNAIDAGSIAAATANKIADHILKRAFVDAAASADGDAKSFRSLLGAVAKLVNRIAVAGGNLTVYESDDVTSLGVQAVTTDAAANPITVLDTV